jgi:hypothetical protein
MAVMSDFEKECLQLRELESAIDEQRRFIGNLKAQKRDTTGERERLSKLLSQLDVLLRSKGIGRAA